MSRFVVLRRPVDLNQPNITENVLVNLDYIQWVEPTRIGGVVKLIMHSNQWICVAGTVEHFRQLMAGVPPIEVAIPQTVREPESNG